MTDMRSEASLPQDMQALMEKYRQEMLALQKRSSLPVTPSRQTPTVSTPAVPTVSPVPTPAAPAKPPETSPVPQPNPPTRPAPLSPSMPELQTPPFFELGQSEEAPDPMVPAPPQETPEAMPSEDVPPFPPLAARDEENNRLLEQDVSPQNPMEKVPEIIYNQDPMPPLDVGEENLPSLTSEQIDTLLSGSSELLVQVSTAKEALPVEGALVQISGSSPEGPILYHSLTTDSNGQTTPVTLPAIDPALTLQPDLPIPVLGYTVEVSKNGYDRFLSNEIVLYGGIKAFLPVTLIPLPDNSLS